MNQENFGGATFEQKLKMLAIMSEKDQARSAENLLGFCENYCRKCPSYIGTSETRLGFCTLGKSAHIKEQKGCLCSQCPIAGTMSMRWNHYCIKGKATELSEAEHKFIH